jgi:hypothetical protein
VAVDLSSLSEADRTDFESRLGIYGLNTSVVEQEVTVQPNQRLQLAYGRETFIRPIVLEVSDFDDLNRMIGIDDRVFETVPSRTPLPEALELGGEDGIPRVTAFPGRARPVVPRMEEALDRLDVGSLEPRQLDNIRVAARAYLRGNSAVVAGYKQVLERTIGIVEIPVWPLLMVRVAAGSTLTFGPGVNVLVAYRVEIEEGGRIVSQGHLKVDATLLQRTTPTGVGPLRPIRTIVGRTIFRGGSDG